MKSLAFDVLGMTHGACAQQVHHALAHLDGITFAAVTLWPGQATVLADSSRLSNGDIESAIGRLGYRATLRPDQPSLQTRPFTRR